LLLKFPVFSGPDRKGAQVGWGQTPAQKTSIPAGLPPPNPKPQTPPNSIFILINLIRINSSDQI
jgi:hypothetical protein